MGQIYTSDLHDKITKLAAEYGYITVDEISIMTNDRRKAFNVLQYLSTKGVLGTFSTDLKPTKAYYLPERTKQIVESSGRVEYVSGLTPARYNPGGFFHHTNLVKVHLIIELILGTRLTEFITEERLKKELGRGKKICDGEFKFTNSKGEARTMGIEVELTLKNAETRRKQARSLSEYMDKYLNGVMVFYNRELIRARMKETFEKHGKFNKPVFFINLFAFLEQKGNVEAENMKGEKVKVFKGVS